MKFFKLPKQSGGLIPALEPAAQALADFLAQRMASSLGPDQKAQTRQGVEHLKNAFIDAGIPLEEFVEDDGLAAYFDELEKRVSPGYLAHLQDIMRQAFRFMCAKGLLALDFSRCAVPSHEKDSHDFSKLERGFPECFEGIYPASLMPRHTARSIRMNRAVPGEIVREFRLVVVNIPEIKRDAAVAAWWFVIRQLALDMRLKSLKELASVEGASRMMDYLMRKGYTRDSITIRKLRSWYNHMQRLGLSGNPFKLKVRKGEVIRWVIDFSRLPERSPKQHFFRVRDRRHVRIDGEDVECVHTAEEMRKIAQYGNPALKGWRNRPAEDLPALFKEAQDILIARTSVFYPPRPIEFWSMNRVNWPEIEGSDGRYVRIDNNALEYKRKRRPPRPVTVAYKQENDALWELRRARFATIGDPDTRESFGPGMISAGSALWVDWKTGRRLSRPQIIKAYRRGLLRIGLKPSRANRASLYWSRRGHQSATRTHSKGQNDKLTAAQAGHSETTMKAKYDCSELIAQADHMAEHLWGPMGVVPATSKPQSVASPPSSPPSAAQYFQSADLSQLAAELFATSGADNPSQMEIGELRQRVHRAALKAGLLSTFAEATEILAIDIRTLERWAEDNHVEKIMIENRRYILKAQINELAQCLTPDEAGLQLGLSGRQVRNLIADGELKGTITMGKKRLIPLACLRAYQTARKKREGEKS